MSFVMRWLPPCFVGSYPSGGPFSDPDAELSSERSGRVQLGLTRSDSPRFLPPPVPPLPDEAAPSGIISTSDLYGSTSVVDSKRRRLLSSPLLLRVFNLPFGRPPDDQERDT